MQDEVLSTVLFSRKCDRVRSEIRECENRKTSASDKEAEVIAAEIDAMHAELEFIKTKHYLDQKHDRLACIYQRYGEMGITQDNWEEYLAGAGSDHFNFIKRRDFLEPMLDPLRVTHDMEELIDDVKWAEKEFTKKLKIWYDKQVEWEKSSGREDV